MDNCRIFFINHRSIYLNSLGDALSQHGHKVFFQSSWNVEEIRRGIAYFKPHLLVTAGVDIPEGLDDLSFIPELCEQFRLPHVYWATEDKIHYERWSLPFVRKIRPDMVLTIHPDCVALYKKEGVAAQYMNFACNPRLFPGKRDLSEEIYAIAFVGTTHLETWTYRYESLKQLLFPLVHAGVRTEVWGYNWDTSTALLRNSFGTPIPRAWQRGYLPYKHTGGVYRQSGIMLGVQNATDQVSQRTFEILGTGAFMIASRTPELQRLFDEGKDIVLSSGPQETLELVDYYSRHPAERQRIGRRARANVLANHTFAARLRQVWPDVAGLVEQVKERCI